MSQQSPFTILGKKEKNTRKGQIKRRRVDVVDVPCMMPVKRTKKQAIVIKDKKVGAGGRTGLFSRTKVKAKVARKDFQRGEGSGLGGEERGEGFTRPVTALWSLW